MKRSVILFRDDVDWQQEKDFANQYFQCFNSRMMVEKGDLVIPRFSALPFYREQEHDINYVGAQLINAYAEHQYIADLSNWIWDLAEYTPRTWDRLDVLPEKGPFVLKGETNSKKFNWKTHMFAETKADAIEIHSRLCNDGLLHYQKIFIREYVPLRTFMIGLQGLPITNEYRFFCYKDRILSAGYYWSSHSEDLIKEGHKLDPACVPQDFLNKILNIVKDNATFYVVDVAETQSGDWIVIELNDGSMSGLSNNNPDTLYRNLKNAIDNDM